MAASTPLGPGWSASSFLEVDRINCKQKYIFSILIVVVLRRMLVEQLSAL